MVMRRHCLITSQTPLPPPGAGRRKRRTRIGRVATAMRAQFVVAVLVLLLAGRVQCRRLRGAAQSYRTPDMPAECTLTPHQYRTCLSAGGCCTASGCEAGKSCILPVVGGGASGPPNDVIESGPSGISDGAVTVHTVQTETRFGGEVPDAGGCRGETRGFQHGAQPG